ncbi:MAG: ABC transporter permease [Dysosmobacter sp.]|uniref:ABC transporter permease n=1 Tax=Dysosmobacter sp. TaxID=2591382 RepID=UPI0026230986|nr:ABC transporter permease [Dysosmobacter sp.]
MLKYIGKRLLQTLLVLFIVSIFAFALIHLAGGNPALLLLPDGASDEAIKAMEHQLGLDQPLYVQYFQYMAGVFRGDLGMSTAYKIPVADIIAERLPYSVVLTMGTVLVGCSLCIPLGIIAGSNRGKAVDFFAMFFALLGNSMSAVWLAVLNVFVFSVWLGVLPSMGAESFSNIILPALTLGYPMAAEITRVGRSGMIDTLSEDYITATYAKGISRRVVNWKYAFKNALIPIITLVGMSIGSYLAGAVVVETVFAWPGIGQLTNQAVGNRDYQLVQSLLLVSATLFTLINLVVDIINSLVDPRVSLE